MRLDELSRAVIGAAIEVHKTVGPGLLESVYQRCLIHEFQIRGIPYESEKQIPLRYKGMALESHHSIDILVSGEMVLELKAVEKVLMVHEAQLLTYLKLTNKRLGLLLNFNVPVMRQGIRRIVNNY